MASFSFIFVFSNKYHYNFYTTYMWKNVHPVYSAGIRTHYLRKMSLLPLDQGSRPSEHTYKRSVSVNYYRVVLTGELPIVRLKSFNLQLLIVYKIHHKSDWGATLELG